MRFRLVLAVFVVAAACADKPTSENVRRWEARKEATKLLKALKHPQATAEVRCEIALALAALGDPGSVLKEASGKAGLAEDLLSCLPVVLGGAEVDKHAHAVSLLGSLIEKADPQKRDSVAPAIGKWIAEDFPRRYQKGLLISLGSRAVAPLVEAQKAGVFKSLARKERESEKGKAMRNLAAVVGAVADRPTRAAVAERIVADFTKGSAVPAAALEALGLLRAEGAAELAKLLVDQKADLSMRRDIPAILADKGDTTSIPKLIPLMESSSEDVYVRGNIILYLNEVCTATCRPHVDKLYRFLREEYPSSAAANAVLKVAGLDALERVLKEMVTTQALSPGEVDKIVKERIFPLGAKALPALVKALRGKNWIGKVIAIRALARLGGKNEVAAVMRLRGEKTRPETWKGETSIGDEAATAVKEIQGRGAAAR